MNGQPNKPIPARKTGETKTTRFSSEVGLREDRKIRSRGRKTRSVWEGFSFFGLVGWSIVLPTLAGAALGRWLDGAYPGERSWTLALLLGGLVLGCLNAWRWISKEHKEIANDAKDLGNHE